MPNIERDKQIREALKRKKPGKVAEELGLSRQQVWRIGKYDSIDDMPEPGGPMFEQLTKSGLKRFGGMIIDDYDKNFNSVVKRINLYREMGDDPIVAAVLQAIKMTLRRVQWRVDCDDPAGAQAKEFLEACMEDMASSWSDNIDQALGMIQYGFQLAEVIYKPRNGYTNQGPAIELDEQGKIIVPERDIAQSKFSDGLIGWRKWLYLAPETLAPGNEWVFDDNGGIRGFQQQAPPDYKPVSVPIEKAILFRTSTEKNNPEGRSILRAMYQPWYMKHNLEEVEAIAAERMGAGFPVIYLGKNIPKGTGSTGDLAVYKDMIRNVRVDEQMGLVFPEKKMGTGAPNDDGVLFELVAPPSRGLVDFQTIINRYEQRMAMVGLAQFIHLGMSQVGTQALAGEAMDFFTMSVEAWADSISDPINRYAVDRLLRLNGFSGLSENPYIAHEPITRQNISVIAEAINKLVGAQLLTPGLDLENWVRGLMDLPPAKEKITVMPGDGIESGIESVGIDGGVEGTAPGEAVAAQGGEMQGIESAKVKTAPEVLSTAALVLANEMKLTREALNDSAA